MGNPFADGSKSLAECDVCGFQYRLADLRKLVVKTVETEIKACRACWVPDQPQLQLGMYPVDDPQAVRDPRPDMTYRQSGLNVNGNPSGGSRIFQWGWAPVGGGYGVGQNDLTPNYLLAVGAVGTVTVSTS